MVGCKIHLAGEKNYKQINNSQQRTCCWFSIIKYKIIYIVKYFYQDKYCSMYWGIIAEYRSKFQKIACSTVTQCKFFRNVESRTGNALLEFWQYSSTVITDQILNLLIILQKSKFAMFVYITILFSVFYFKC